MHASRRATNQAWAAQNVTSYSYLFNVLVNGMPNSIGATHFQEVAFMLDNTNGLGYPQNGLPNPFGGEPQSYMDLARLMTRMWAAFISGQDPNLSGGRSSFPDSVIKMRGVGEKEDENCFTEWTLLIRASYCSHLASLLPG